MHCRVPGVLFVGLSLDEAASLHEVPDRPLRSWLHLDGILFYGWVLPGTAFVVLALLILHRFLLQESLQMAGVLTFLFALPTFAVSVQGAGPGEGVPARE